MGYITRESKVVRISIVLTVIQSIPLLALSGAQLSGTGDKATSGQIHASVVKVKRTSEIVSSNRTVKATEGYSLLAVTVRFENSGQTSAVVTLPKDTTTVQGRSPVPRYDLGDMGVALGDSSRFVFGSKGVMEISSADGSWKLTGDFTKHVWSVTVGAGGALDTLMVFSVRTETAPFVLNLPDFTPLLLDK